MTCAGLSPTLEIMGYVMHYHATHQQAAAAALATATATQRKVNTDRLPPFVCSTSRPNAPLRTTTYPLWRPLTCCHRLQTSTYRLPQLTFAFPVPVSPAASSHTLSTLTSSRLPPGARHHRVPATCHLPPPAAVRCTTHSTCSAARPLNRGAVTQVPIAQT